MKAALALAALGAGSLLLLATRAQARASSSSVLAPSGELAADTEGGEGAGFADLLLAPVYAVGDVFSAGGLHTSDAGLAFIEHEEGLRLDEYLDEASRPTIYIGHLVKPGEVFNHTEAEARAYLAQDVASAEDAIRTLVTVALTQAQFDSLVSLVFNIGAHNFRTSTILRLINAGDWNGAAAQFARWKYITVGGVKEESAELVGRRSREAALFARADYSGVFA